MILSFISVASMDLIGFEPAFFDSLRTLLRNAVAGYFFFWGGGGIGTVSTVPNPPGTIRTSVTRLICRIEDTQNC
jgi:hypothetical protein